jgi:hypothetical protein
MIFSQSQLGILPTIGNGTPAILQMAAIEMRVTSQMEITAIAGVDLVGIWVNDGDWIYLYDERFDLVSQLYLGDAWVDGNELLVLIKKPDFLEKSGFWMASGQVWGILEDTDIHLRSCHLDEFCSRLETFTISTIAAIIGKTFSSIARIIFTFCG